MVAGTAAPVIAVALAVVATDLTGKTRTVPDSGSGYWIWCVSLVATAVDFGAMVILLFMSLGSLARESDIAPDSVATALAGFGLACVAFLAGSSALLTPGKNAAASKPETGGDRLSPPQDGTDTKS